MGMVNNIWKSAKKNILGNNSSPNQLINERFVRQPNITSQVVNNGLKDDYYQDDDDNGIDDRFEPRKVNAGQNITGIQKHPNPKEFNPFSFKGKFKNYNVSYDRRGRYVPTATYPLPPLNHQQKLIDRNRRMNNKDNKFV